jgi:hypothetical protein
VPEISKPRADDATGVPGLASWPRVYFFVAACFVVWLTLLTLLTLAYT